MKLRIIEFVVDEDTDTRSLNDIREYDVPPKEPIAKTHLAMRRKFLRDLDKQIELMINGQIDEINIVAMR